MSPVVIYILYICNKRSSLTTKIAQMVERSSRAEDSKVKPFLDRMGSRRAVATDFFYWLRNMQCWMYFTNSTSHVFESGEKQVTKRSTFHYFK